MSLSGLIPSEISINAAIAICAIAFVSGTARGFSGFGSALIFMPLASSIGAPALVAAVLLVIDFCAAAPLLPNAWKQADRKATAIMVCGALVGVPVGTYFLSRLEPVTTRWIISGFVLALLALLLSGQGPCDDLGRHRRALRFLQRAGADRRPADRRLLARPSDRFHDCTRQYPAVVRRLGFLFRRQLFADRADHGRLSQIFACRRPGLRHRRLVRCFFVRPRQRDRVSRDLLRPDRGGGSHRPAGARRRAARRLG